MKPLDFSSKKIVAFLAVGLASSLVLSLLISKHLSHAVSTELSNREMELVFGAIESGPLAISRLHSSAIAQQELVRLMSNPRLSRRGFLSAQITGGSNSTFRFAFWESTHQTPQHCQETIQRKFIYPDALNPFIVGVVKDTCFVLAEERTIFSYSSFASIGIAVLAGILLIIAAWPAAISIRRAERFLALGIEGRSSVEVSDISFKPIRSLVDQALRSMLLERDAAFTKIASQMSHDIRSPLSALNMVVKTLDGVPDQKRALIEKAIQRINDISNDLLRQTSRGPAIENNSIAATSTSAVGEMKFVPTLVSDLLRDLYSEKRATLNEPTQIEFKLDLGGPADARVNVDVKELSRALSNLLNNALEATGESGTVKLAFRSSLNEVAIIISDDGKGIPEEILKRLGRERLSFDKTNEGSGSGLGVLHARQTIEAMGGRWDIQSRLGQGTIVTMRFSRSDL